MNDPELILGEQAALAARVARLTDGEREVIALLARGQYRREIAATLGRSEEAIKMRLNSALKKLGARNGPHAVALLYSARYHAEHAVAGDRGESYRAALGAIRAILDTLGPLQMEVATLATAMERLAQQAARRPRRAS